MGIRRMAVFLAALLLWLVCAGAEETVSDVVLQGERRIVYGYSELGRELECRVIGDEAAAKSLLLIFGVHGFEDDFPHDAQILRMIAEEVIGHYIVRPEKLQGMCLYIVPSANPDGLQEGTTQNGFGRCNARGLDINRDFPVGWRKRTESRNRTGDAPFSTAEARAIRDLVERAQPTWGVDVHGWINASYGDGRMARIFAKPFGFSVKQPVSGGMLCSWMNEVMEEAIMLELPYAPNTGRYVQDNSQRLIEGIDRWLEVANAEEKH